LQLLQDHQIKLGVKYLKQSSLMPQRHLVDP
jgi:hypothetical protein